MNSDFEIKRVGPDEVALAKSLFEYFQIEDGVPIPSLSSDSYLQTLLARDDFHVVVAVSGEMVIGGLTAYELRKYKSETVDLYLYELSVMEAFRKRGVATDLIDYLKSICVAKGIREMFVGAFADNDPAKNLYEKTFGNGEEVFEYTHRFDRTK